MKFLKAVVPALIVLIVAWMITSALKATTPKAERRSRSQPPPSVEVVRVEPGPYQIMIHTRGEVRARTRSVLIPEVPGRIVEISEDFRDGGFFGQGDLLVSIDKSDYQTALAIAESNVAEAENANEQEKARAAQAEENWKRLGKGGVASELVLRRPQLAESQARLHAAKAQVFQANTDLKRTEIRAPFQGRILEQLVDVGQFVTTGTDLARIFADDLAEIRLPLTNRQTGFIDLPEDSSDGESQDLPTVTLSKQQGLQTFTWEGKIVRTDSAIDSRSRQLFVVAQVEDPSGRLSEREHPLKIGEFVEAQITGRLLQNVFTIPRTAMRGNQLFIIDDENRLRFRDVEFEWGDDDNVIVSSGLEPGESVCTKPPAYAIEGAEVRPMSPRTGNGAEGGSPRPSSRPQSQ